MPAPTVTVRPLTPDETAYLRRDRPRVSFRVTLFGAALCGMLVTLVVTPCLGLPLLAQLITGKGWDHLSPRELLVEWLIAFVLAYLVTAIWLASGELRRWTRLNRLRNQELAAGQARQINATADRIWKLNTGLRWLLLLRVTPDDVLILPLSSSPKEPAPDAIGPTVRLVQLPQSGDTVSLRFCGDPIPIGPFPISDISHGHLSGLVRISNLTPAAIAALKS